MSQELELEPTNLNHLPEVNGTNCTFASVRLTFELRAMDEMSKFHSSLIHCHLLLLGTRICGNETRLCFTGACEHEAVAVASKGQQMGPPTCTPGPPTCNRTVGAAG